MLLIAIGWTLMLVFLSHQPFEIGWDSGSSPAAELVFLGRHSDHEELIQSRIYQFQSVSPSRESSELGFLDSFLQFYRYPEYRAILDFAVCFLPSSAFVVVAVKVEEVLSLVAPVGLALQVWLNHSVEVFEMKYCSAEKKWRGRLNAEEGLMLHLKFVPG